MTQHQATPNNDNQRTPNQTVLGNTYYSILGLHPSASVIEIRRTYWELSKLYHPDTTNLPTEIATAKFHQINEAYAILSNPERRLLYDQKIGYSRINVIAPPAYLNRPSQSRTTEYSSAYLDPTDRPLSAGELFALFILGLTFIVCIMLAIAIGLTRGNTALQVSLPHKLHSIRPLVTQEQVILFSSKIQI